METLDARKHKGLGIASFLVTVIVCVLMFLLIAIAGLLTAAHKATPELNTMIGISLVFFWLVDFVGIGLGIAGAFDRASKKAFPILGIVIGTAVLLVSGAVLVAGLAMKA
jgi:hypothetical protein